MAMALDPVELSRAAGITPDPWQADLLRSDERQAILLCSRQSGKSTVTSALGLHTALFQAGALVLLLAGVFRQSAELFGKVRALYDQVSGIPGIPRLTDRSATRLLFANGSRVLCLPGNAEGIRGFSAPSLVVIDEAAFAPDALYESLRPMLAVSRGRLVLLSTPFGARGFLWREFTDGGPAWKRVRVTAEDCPRIDPEWLENERRTQPKFYFDQEYRCLFVDTIDSYFSTDDILRALSPDVAPLFEEVA
jgi:hypothetical protein